MPPKREKKQLLFGLEARQTALSGAEKLYKAVSSTYGALGYNVLQGMPYGDPVLTRDGVTVAKRTILPDAAENDAAAVLRQASEKTNKTAGDGTTATVVLGYNLLAAAHQLVVAGQNAMILKKQIATDANVIIDWLNGQSEDGSAHLLEVATVSAGDPAIGALISDTMKEVGVDGGITIQEQSYPTVDVEKIDGYYFNRGWNALNAEVTWERPIILVSQKRIASNVDAIPLIQFAMENKDTQKLVIVGDVSGEALQTFMQNTMAQQDASGRPHPFECLVINPGVYGDDGKLWFEDIATYVGAKVLMEGADAKGFQGFGTAKKVRVSADQSIIFGGAGAEEDVAARAAEIKARIDKETNPHAKDQLEQRYSKLLGKVAIVNVGGSTPAEMEELRFRVEDAIEATKSAMADGVLPGGGTTLVHATELPISDLFKTALKNTFTKLMENAAESSEYRFRQILSAKHGFGVNLRDITDDLIDLRKAGIWDATRAVTQTVENAASSAGALLTVDTIITPLDDETNS